MDFSEGYKLFAATAGAIFFCGSIAASAETGDLGVQSDLIKAEGKVMFKADFKITNPNDFAVKDVRILCAPSANSGTIFRATSVTIYEIIPAKQTKIVRGITVGPWPEQSTGSRCLTWTAERARR
jgi:hypothetical protein